MNHNFLAIIPARAGSKRLKNKNILDLNGKPLIEWSIESAKRSKYITTCVVSSDSEEILNISKKLNIDTIKRPSELAKDESSSVDMAKHVLLSYREFDFLVLLQPTSPLRNEQHIDEAIELLIKTNADAIISVCEVEHSPLWSNTLSDDGDMSNFLDTNVINKRSQDLKQYYRLNGAIYICKIERFLEESSFFIKDNIFAYKMDRKDSIDIDDELDYKIAQVIMEEKC
jgi:CMP-N-acetylneuraminic acid synthetase